MTDFLWVGRLFIRFVQHASLTVPVPVQTGDSNMCLAYYEHQCAGICSSEERLEPIYEACLRDPLKKGQNARQAAIH